MKDFVPRKPREPWVGPQRYCFDYSHVIVKHSNLFKGRGINIPKDQRITAGRWHANQTGNYTLDGNSRFGKPAKTYPKHFFNRVTGNGRPKSYFPYGRTGVDKYGQSCQGKSWKLDTRGEYCAKCGKFERHPYNLWASDSERDKFARGEKAYNAMKRYCDKCLRFPDDDGGNDDQPRFGNGPGGGIVRMRFEYTPKPTKIRDLVLA